jgi:hypothetical protein
MLPKVGEFFIFRVPAAQDRSRCGIVQPGREQVNHKELLFNFGLYPSAEHMCIDWCLLVDFEIFELSRPERQFRNSIQRDGER